MYIGPVCVCVFWGTPAVGCRRLYSTASGPRCDERQPSASDDDTSPTRVLVMGWMGARGGNLLVAAAAAPNHSRRAMVLVATREQRAVAGSQGAGC